LEASALAAERAIEAAQSNNRIGGFEI